MNKQDDKAEAQRNRVQLELVGLRRATAHLAAVNLLHAFDTNSGIDWARLCVAMQYAGGFDALRAAQNINDGNDSSYVNTNIAD